MEDLAHKKVLVIGSDPGGIAACALLRHAGSKVLLLPASTQNASQNQTNSPKSLGTETVAPDNIPSSIDLVVHSSQVSPKEPVVARFKNSGIPVLSDLELGGRMLFCLNIAISGTNGKTTTAELVAAMLENSQRKTIRAGASGEPICDIIEQSRTLDFATLDLNSFQVESIHHFRPAVAVVTNLRSDHMDRYASLNELALVIGRIFKNQQVFDWAVIQSEALAHLRSLEIPIPSKIITFSANNRRADLFLDRGLLISTLPNWSGPLFNMEQSALMGPHNAENVMAALAVGHILRLPLEEMIAAVRAYRPGPHRLELVAESAQGIKFINNSKAMNVDAVAQSIEALPGGRAGEPNIWLIAGGKDKALDYHDLGPLLARRVKGAFLFGESREKLRAAWSLFTPCTVVDSLLEAVSKAAESAEAEDYVLLSPACSSFDMFQSYQHRGEVFREAVQQVLAKADINPGPVGDQNYSIAS